MQFIVKALLAICLISAANAASPNRRSLMNLCPVDASKVDADLENLGPYKEPTIELGDLESLTLLQSGSSASSFSVDTAGVGQATGVSFTVPAHAEANVSINLGVPALTSEQVRNLRNAWEAILDLTQRQSLREFERQDRTASRNLGFLSWLCGGKTRRSSTTVRRNMESRGLTEDQINQLIETFREIALQMSTVQVQFTIFNRNNPYSVSGNVLLWVMSGVIQTSETQTQFRVLSDGGIATGNQGNANAGGEIIPLTL